MSGYLWVVIKDKNRGPEHRLGVIKVALDNIKPYNPIHFSTRLPVKKEEMADPEAECLFSWSLCLEKPILGQDDSLCYVAVKAANFNPLPSNVKRFSLALVTETVDSFELPIRNLDLDNLATMDEIITDHRNSSKAAFISQWMRTTPDVIDNMFGALTYFAIPKSYLGSRIGMFLLIRDE